LRFRPDHRSGTWNGYWPDAGPQRFDGDWQPVVGVTWDEAVAFARWVSKVDGRLSYRLPTEAEWEWACRAGGTSRYWWGDDARSGWRYANGYDQATRRLVGVEREAWEGDDGYRASAPVGSYAPNPWGLFDMIGNVREWCSDWYGPYGTSSVTDPTGAAEGSRRALRGGSWFDVPVMSRCASRGRYPPDVRRPYNGLRLVVEIAHNGH
jgi:formylglycine-generating enzyme required for sulfatase activity